MSDLAQYNHNKLTTDAKCIAPGVWVNHIEDGESFGMVVASSGDQASVLWSKAPRPVQPNFSAPTAPTPKRATAWQHTTDEIDRIGQMYGAGMISKSFVREYFDLAEVYSAGELGPDEMQKMSEEGAKVTFEMNGEVTVERKVDQLPPYVNPRDVRRSRY